MNTNQTLRRTLALTVLAALLAARSPRAALAAAADPVEGKWYGTAGLSDNQTGFGLDIRTNEKGELAPLLYMEVMSWYGEPLPPLQKNGSAYAIPALGLDFRVEGDRLVGTMGKGGEPVEMKRTAALPSEPAVPVDIPSGPGPRWKALLGAAIYATPAVRDAYAYVGTAGGVFNAVKVNDGSFAWTFSAGRPILGEALVTDDAVYFVCDNGFLFRLNRRDGKEIWRYDLGDAQVSRILPHAIVYDYDHDAPMPVLADGVLFVGSGDGSFHAVSVSDGKRVWRIAASGKVRNTALVLGPNVVFGSWGGELKAVSRSTGETVWTQDLKAPVTATPVVIGGRLVIGTRGSVLLGLNPDTGERLWRKGFWGSWVESTAVAGDDGLGYIGSSDLRRITSFDPKDGRIVWRTDVYGAPWGRPLVTENFVYDGVSAIVPYMTRHTGGVSALDRKTGRLVWRFPLPNPPGTLHYGFAGSPTRAGELFVIGGMDGVLYAFPLR